MRPHVEPRPKHRAQLARTGLLAIGVALAVLLAVAALACCRSSRLVRGPEPHRRQQTSQAEPQQLFVDDADKALCEAIGPLMKESNDELFLAEPGKPDSPERAAAIPQFKADTLGLGDRIQKLLNEHANPPRYLDPDAPAIHRWTCFYTAKTCIRTAVPTHSTKQPTTRRSIAYGGPLAPATRWAFGGSCRRWRGRAERKFSGFILGGMWP